MARDSCTPRLTCITHPFPLSKQFGTPAPEFCSYQTLPFFSPGGPAPEVPQEEAAPWTSRGRILPLVDPRGAPSLPRRSCISIRPRLTTFRQLERNDARPYPDPLPSSPPTPPAAHRPHPSVLWQNTKNAKDVIKKEGGGQSGVVLEGVGAWGRGEERGEDGGREKTEEELQREGRKEGEKC
ncbi:hypothetical protein E2C01_041256 [Portunus trituberculatus]|uniref:Uncharacterized protein n=1 Tax=Portunus trituberculatus TaxID=210409 RepID=A0A5B7FQ77_PORTR|nr:hypothetical protein [Portunus trituberculatus]